MKPDADDRSRAEVALDALLARGPESAAARARLAADPEGQRELAALEQGLVRAGDELRARGPGARQEARFVSRVLALTTRQDLSWRGDLRLALDFLRARLRASPALRLVAASLALHLVAGPVVAYWILHEKAPAKGITVHVELPAEDPFGPEVPEEALGDSELVRLARAREAHENAEARERFVLEQRGPTAPVVALPADAPLALRLLAERARFLRAPRAVPPSDEPEPPAPGAEPAREALELALWLEAALDRRVLVKRSAPALSEIAQRLSAHLASDAFERSWPGTAALGRAALARARALGAMEGEKSPGAASVPGADWSRALAEAGVEAGLGADPLWRAWVEWGRE